MHPITQSYSTGVSNVDIVPLVKQIGHLVKDGQQYQDSFTKIAKNEMNCSSTMFFKAKYYNKPQSILLFLYNSFDRNNMEKIEIKRLSLYYLLSKLITGQVSLMARQDLSKNKTEMMNLLAMTDTYNSMLTDDASIPPSTHPAKNTNLLSVLHNNK